MQEQWNDITCVLLAKAGITRDLCVEVGARFTTVYVCIEKVVILTELRGGFVIVYKNGLSLHAMVTIATHR